MNVDLKINEIKRIIPLIEPSLLLDGVTELTPGETASGYKLFSEKDWFFKSHFPNDPNVPSGIMIDAMSQILLMTFLSLDGNAGKITACMRIDKVELKRKIVPSEQLNLFAKLKSFRNGIAIGYTEGYVNDEFTCKSDFVIGIPTEIRVPRLMKR